MTKKGKRMISLLLTVAVMLSVCVPLSSYAAAPNSTYNVAVTVTTDKDGYNWGEDIAVTVSTVNNGDEVIDYATVSLVPKFGKFFSQPEAESIACLANGADKEVTFTVHTSCSGLARILLPFFRFFNIGVTSGYSRRSLSGKSKVKVGSFTYELGVELAYGSENTPTGKELENIKDLNGGTLPDVYMDEEDSTPSMIDGAFSGDKIRNEKDALNAIDDVKNLIGVDNVSQELSFTSKDSFDSQTFYRFQQYYKGLEVYGKNVIVAAENQKTTALSNDYEPQIEINTTPSITAEQAKQAVQGTISNAANLVAKGLKIYANETDPTLVYMISCEGSYRDEPFCGNVFVDANLGFVLSVENAMSSESVTGTESGMTFNVWKNSDDSYDLYDHTRNIRIYDAGRQTTIVYVDETMQPNNPVTSTSSSNWNQEAATMMSGLSKIYDYYKAKFNRNGFNGKNGELIGIINDGDMGGGIPGNNGGSWSDYDWSKTFIAIGFVTGCSRVDVLAHEYLHSTERYIANMTGGDTETGGLKEAYADIMGEVLEADISGGQTDWMHGNSRNVANPASTRNPVKNSDPAKNRLYTFSNGTSTTSECHNISTVVSHAAYLMQKDKITDMNRLGELWYRSMYYLTENAGFTNCRTAVIAAARDMNMSQAEIGCIQSAFDKVEIFTTKLTDTGSSSISGRVLDSATGNPVAGVKVMALNLLYAGYGIQVVETNANGYFSITGLTMGVYEIFVSATNYMPAAKLGVSVGDNANVYLQDAILIGRAFFNEKGIVAGKITNAINGKAVSDATIKFRKNHGNKEGSYVNDVEIKTDSSGRYTSDALTSGYYTMEVSKDGFITGYFDVIACPSNKICENQNFSVSPVLPEGQYRIVLTWGENPRDLDSHITGTTSSGSSFHVYFGNKDAWDGSIHTANLDYDDTTSYGPETVTLIPTTAKTYRYYVYRYAGSGSIATSGAHIEVFKGNARIAVYDAPTNQGTGDYWTVFEITNGMLKTVNRMGSGVYSS